MAKKFRRVVPDNIKIEELSPLNITCGATKCNENLHCFSLKQTALKRFGKTHVCIECGQNLIDWNRMHKNDILDANYIFQSLRFELIRHVFWHTKIEDKALQNATKKGRNNLRHHALQVLKSKVGKNNFFDGRQTPLGGGDIVNYAQHATGSCCRKCMETWHNIPKQDNLNEEQLTFFTNLIMLYINERVPGLSDDPQD